MTDTPEAKGDSGGDTAQPDREALEAFLKSAPPELAGWAAGELRRLGAAPSAATPARPGGAGPVPGPAEPEGPEGPELDTAVAEDSEDDEPDDFYDDMEGEDDILQRGPRNSGARKQRHPETRPAGGPIEAGPRRSRTLTPRLRGVLVAALIVGVAGGIWYAGRSGEDTASTPPSMSTEQGGQADTVARIGELEDAVAVDPRDVEARLELGVQYFNLRMIEQAREQWETVVEIDESNATAWYNLGFYHLSSDPADMAAAEAAWQRVIELDPGSDMAATISMHLQGLDMSGSDDGPEE